MEADIKNLSDVLIHSRIDVFKNQPKTEKKINVNHNIIVCNSWSLYRSKE